MKIFNLSTLWLNRQPENGADFAFQAMGKHCCCCVYLQICIQANAPEWQWWAYGAMVGGYGLAKRAIAGVQQVAEKHKETNHVVAE